MMFNDSIFGIPAAAPIRFRATWPGGTVEQHEMPAGAALPYAEELRALGLAVTWYPFAPPPAPTPQPDAPRRERKRAQREQRRQFAELGIQA